MVTAIGGMDGEILVEAEAELPWDALWNCLQKAKDTQHAAVVKRMYFKIAEPNELEDTNAIDSL